MKLLLKRLTILVLSSLLVFNNFALAATHEDFSSNLIDAQEKLRNGEMHVKGTNYENDPNKYFELFRYTALDELVNCLKFEKNPYDYIEQKYGKKFNIIGNCCTAFGAILGAGLGVLSWNFFKNKNETKKDVKNTDAKSNENLHKVKNSFIFSVVDFIHIFLFGFLAKFFSSFCLNKFKENQFKKLEVEKGNALLATKLLLKNIEQENWKYGDSILIQLNTDIDHPLAAVTIIDSNLNYSDEERSNSQKSFENLKQNLEKILEINN